MALKIAFFDTKPYDKESFEFINKKYKYELKFFKTHLTKDNIVLTKEMDVILIKSLKTGKIGAAGLDVYEEENNYFFEDMSNFVLTDDLLARLLTFNNVIITSHQGFFTREAMDNIAETTMESIREWYTGEKLTNKIEL